MTLSPNQQSRLSQDQFVHRTLAQHIHQRNADWADQGLERFPSEFSSAQNPVSTVDGREFLLFSSSNYLGLSTHPRVLAAAHEALDTFGSGSGGSRLTTGSASAHRKVEHQLAEWLNYDAAVFYATGYQANVGVITAIADESTTIFSDAKNHASIIDACRLSRAHTRIFPHLDAQSLDQQLSQCETDYALVVTDGLFSMDGTTAPLRELVDVTRRHGAWLLVDEAHSIGTLGEHGQGLLEENGMIGAKIPQSERPDIVVGTASKAMGAEGGFVCCSQDVERLLRNQSRPYVYSTSNAVPNMAAVGAAVAVLQDHPELVATLHSNITYLVDRLQEAGIEIPTRHPHSPIIPIRVGEERRAIAVSAALRNEGIHVPAIRYPTVARGQAMLRVTMMSTHTKEHIDTLVDALRRAMVNPTMG